MLIEGFIGHPANEYRMSGVHEVFEDYPGINVLASETGSWDEATGQQVMADFLAAYPDLDGYWTQDGMAIGAFEAVKAPALSHIHWASVKVASSSLSCGKKLWRRKSRIQVLRCGKCRSTYPADATADRSAGRSGSAAHRHSQSNPQRTGHAVDRNARLVVQ